MKRNVPAIVARGILAKVPAHVSFWLCTNENLRSLVELSEALAMATDDVFRYHVNRDKNDFEAWIREIVKDKDLAREIARVKTKETLIRKISERTDELKTVLKRNIPKKRRQRPKITRRAARKGKKMTVKSGRGSKRRK
ncbi:hypothetical protein HYU17_04630 [Candidatus Woesearchaeota archaeon]|nr:hypothetical protein [Candidatus Woesearchaeota archaeon]